MMIFGFGFLLGGFTAMLVLGLLSLSSQKTEARESQAPVREPVQEVTNPELYPRLFCLNGAKDRSPFPGHKKKAFS